MIKKDNAFSRPWREVKRVMYNLSFVFPREMK